VRVVFQHPSQHTILTLDAFFVIPEKLGVGAQEQNCPPSKFTSCEIFKLRNKIILYIILEYQKLLTDSPPR